MHGNLLRRCDMCPNWCDRRNEEIGNEKILIVGAKKWKEFIKKLSLKNSWGVIRKYVGFCRKDADERCLGLMEW